MDHPFRIAKPVWAAGRENEMNLFLSFSCAVPRCSAVLTLTASTIYSCYINGQFAFQGPARGPKGFYRVDCMDLSSYLTKESNIIDIEVGGYNCNSYQYICQPSFLQAEVTCREEVLSATGVRGFRAVPMTEKVQRVQRYSFQRVFTEAYRLNADSFSYRCALPDAARCIETAVQPDKALLKRGIHPLKYPRANAVKKISVGPVDTHCVCKNHWSDRCLEEIGPLLKGFPIDRLDFVASYEVDDLKCHFETLPDTPYTGDDFAADTAAIYAFDHNLSGMLGCTVTCKTPATVYLVFDELLTDGDIEFGRADTASIIKYELQPGKYDLLSFETYVMQYLKVIVIGGECRIDDLHLLQVINPDECRALDTDNAALKKIYDAACETFRQNAVDIFMDCPSRERAGWLCDSFWTGRAAYFLTGNTLLEHNFLENFLLPEKFDDLPDGMFPMCYPADHYDGNFIPNWAMWLVLELEEYEKRSGDSEMIKNFRSKIYNLIHYFDPFVNSDGLLEKLDRWVFVEWSKSNDYVQDVSYPSNMMFAAMLEAASRMYGDDCLAERAAAIKETVRKQSFNGRFFTDNAVRRDGQLVNEGHMTESCQYYAFFTGTASPETYPQLWHTLITEFGPQRKQKNSHPEVDFANAFVGNYLRLECMWREGLKEQMIREIQGYFLKMADLTGTLWEHDDIQASCNHGFASYAALWIQAVLANQ